MCDLLGRKIVLPPLKEIFCHVSRVFGLGVGIVRLVILITRQVKFA
jgi:hypothetical protein